MEFCCNTNLFEEINNRKDHYEDIKNKEEKFFIPSYLFTQEEVISFLKFATRILFNLYGAKIMHRDIKPDNILIHHNLKYFKLADFGSAINFSESENIGVDASKKGHGFMKNDAYSIPNYEYQKNTFINDMWSFGSIIYQLLYDKKINTKLNLIFF